MTQWQAAGSSHIGGRDENQDDFVILEGGNREELLVVVADGMGGHRGGATAAREIVEAAREIWARRKPGAPLQTQLKALVDHAHERVRTINEQQEGDAQSTLAALWLRDEEAASVHVGDSRIIHFGDGALIERTIDHSVAQLHVLAGKIREEELATHPDQAKLITSIGGEDAPDPEYKTWDLQKGREFVVCSDGFWEVVSPEQQAALLRTADPEQALAREIHRQLENAADSHDNTTAVLVRDASQRGRGLSTRVAGLAALGLGVIAALAAAWLLTTGTPEQTPPATDTGEPQAPPTERTEKPVDESIENAPADSQHKKLDEDLRDTGKAAPEQGNKLPDLPAHDPLNRDVRIDYPDDGDGADSLTEWLQRGEILGERETVTERRRHPGGAGGESIRFELRHDGLPIWGAVINARVMDGEIVQLQGEVPGTIELPDTPVLPYPEALERAGQHEDVPFEALDDGRLHALRVSGDTYTRAWHGRVRGERDERVLIDAHDGTLLARWPATTEQPSR